MVFYGTGCSIYKESDPTISDREHLKEGKQSKRSNLVEEFVYVHETPITMGDVCKLSSEDRPLEAFGVGTAGVVSGVAAIGLDGRPDIEIPEYEGGLGPVERALHNRTHPNEIQQGKAESGDWSFVRIGLYCMNVTDISM